MTPNIKDYSTESKAILGGRVKPPYPESGAMAKLRGRQKETLGSRLREARVGKNLTQEKLGEMLGVTNAQISYYESDKDAPPYDKLILLAQTLGRTPNFLLTGTEGAAGEMIDPETYRLVVKVRELPEALQEFVYEAIRLADSTKHLIPPKFVTPPNKESWQEFQAYLTRLAQSLPPEQKPPKSPK